MSTQNSIETIGGAFTPLFHAITKGVDKFECYSFLAGFALDIVYALFFYFTPTFKESLRVLPLWLSITAIIGLWIVFTGVMYGIAVISTQIISWLANKFSDIPIRNEQSNQLIISHQVPFPIAARFTPPAYQKLRLNLHQISLVFSTLIILLPLLYILSIALFCAAAAFVVALMISYYFQYVEVQRYFFALRSLWAEMFHALPDGERGSMFVESMRAHLEKTE